jgi:hypothetical protein
MLTVDLGTTPHHIAPLKRNHPEFAIRNHQLAIAFINQIRRHYGQPPRGAGLYITTKQQSWGLISSVALDYDEVDEEATAYAMAILLDINLALAEWDEQSKAAIGPPRVPRVQTVWDEKGRMIDIEHELTRWAA